MPVRQQWARCYIKEYRNFGARSTSPTEGSKKDVKSYLIHGNSDPFTLAKSTEELVITKEDSYTKQLTYEDVIIRNNFLGREWLHGISNFLSYQEMDLLGSTSMLNYRCRRLGRTQSLWESATMSVRFRISTASHAGTRSTRRWS